MQKKNNTIQAEITTLGYGGQAVYKGSGITLFIPRGLPGDKALIKIGKLKKNYGSGTLAKILEPSPHRVPPHCKAFEQGCGGCQWLHFDYKQQLFHKTKIVRETLKHIGKLNIKVEPTIGMLHPFHYRNKLSLHRDENGRIGLCRENSQDIVMFDECRQELPANVAAYQVLKKCKVPAQITQAHLRSNTSGELGIEFFSKYSPDFIKPLAGRIAAQIEDLAGIVVRTYRGYHNIMGQPFLNQKIGDSVFSIPHGSFFQTNYEQAQTLLQLVRKGIEVNSKQVVVDVYSGVGFFAIDLAPHVKSVIGIESDRRAVEAACYNAKLNKLTNCNFIEADVLYGLEKIKEKHIDCLILDPPRLGCEQRVLEGIVRLQPARIIYISCAPDTLARDLALLVRHGYEVLDCQPLDMFPHTYHIESVVRLARK